MKDKPYTKLDEQGKSDLFVVFFQYSLLISILVLDPCGFILSFCSFFEHISPQNEAGPGAEAISASTLEGVEIDHHYNY